MTTDTTVRQIRWTTAVPWLRLGEATGIALSPQQIALGCLAALIWAVLATVFSGGWWPAPSEKKSLIGERQAQIDAIEAELKGVRPTTPITPTPAELVTPTVESPWWQVQADELSLAGPVASIVTPITVTASTGSWWRLIPSAAALLLWSIFGLAISRCAAIQFGRDDSPSFREAVQFALSRFVHGLSALIVPLGGAFGLLFLTAILVLPGWVPALGTVWLLVTAPVAMIFGTAAAGILLLLPLLWPLMLAAISADDGDGFDAFSRAFSCFASNLWQTVVLVVLSTGIALVTGLLLAWLLSVGEQGVLWSTDWVFGERPQEALAPLLTWWRGVFQAGIMASLFWTLTTIVYLFLRQSTDAKPLSHIAGTEDEPPRSEQPIVGRAAVEPPPAT